MRCSFQVSVNDSLSQVGKTASGVSQGLVLGPILFVIYVNNLADNLVIDHLLYANYVKLIAPRKHTAALQGSLVTSSKWSDDWELILNPSRSEHFPVGDTFNPVKYSLTPHTLSNAQPIPAVNTVPDLGLLLNTGLSADDIVSRGMFFLP